MRNRRKLCGRGTRAESPFDFSAGDQAHNCPRGMRQTCRVIFSCASSPDAVGASARDDTESWRHSWLDSRPASRSTGLRFPASPAHDLATGVPNGNRTLPAREFAPDSARGVNDVIVSSPNGTRDVWGRFDQDRIGRWSGRTRCVSGRSLLPRPSAVADLRPLRQFQSGAAFGWHAQAGDRVADSSVERLQSHL